MRAEKPKNGEALGHLKNFYVCSFLGGLFFIVSIFLIVRTGRGLDGLNDLEKIASLVFLFLFLASTVMWLVMAALSKKLYRRALILEALKRLEKKRSHQPLN
jgi:hypothetical protein